MPATPIVATDEMHALFWEAWKTGAAPLNGGEVPLVYWDGVIDTPNRPMDNPWATVTVRHTTAPQTSLAGADATRRYTRFGIITIQVFVPLTLDQRLSLSQSLAIIAESAYTGKTTEGGVWFRNVRTNEVGATEAWYQTNILVDFEYDEFR